MKEKQQPDSAVVKAARVIGKVVGKVAAATGVHGGEPQRPARGSKGKLPKKNKHRLPRRIKKAQKRATGASVSRQLGERIG